MHEPNRLLTIGSDLRVTGVPRQRNKRPSARKRSDEEARSSRKRNEPQPRHMLPPFLRHRALLMAALRVWELRHGIRDSW